MNKARLVRWYTPWRSHVARQDDWADQGTAFGLDMSLGPVAAAASESPPPRQPGTGGVQRLTARRRAPG